MTTRIRIDATRCVRTAQALRDLKHRGRIVMLSEETSLRYDRPPLPKTYLQGKAGDEQIHLLPREQLKES